MTNSRRTSRDRKTTPGCTARSLALHTQAVLQGAFVLARAKGGAEIAAGRVGHLRRCMEMLFGREERAQRLRQGDLQ